MLSWFRNDTERTQAPVSCRPLQSNFDRMSSPLPSMTSQSIYSSWPLTISGLPRVDTVLFQQEPVSFDRKTESQADGAHAEIDQLSWSSSSTRSSPSTHQQLDTPRCDGFFDPDVIFPNPLPILHGFVDCSLVSEVVWEDWAHRRVGKMVEKETQTMPLSGPVYCGIGHACRLEVVTWLLDVSHSPTLSHIYHA